MINNKIKIAIIGVSGYVGAELLKIALNHKFIDIKSLIASNNIGIEISKIYPNFINANLPKINAIENVDFKDIDVVFTCLPHGTSQKIISDLKIKYSKLKIIDLSADYRITDGDEYEKWYGKKHIALNLQKKAVYGLSEFVRNEIKNNKPEIIACPGCYPTSVLLPLLPLLDKNDLIDVNDIIIDSKSGVSGAGRSLKIDNLFCEINDSVKAYSVNGHRHIAEINQELSKKSNSKVLVNFVPHLIPMNRGIISTIYLKTVKPASYIKNILQKRFENELFVNIVEGQTYPTTAEVSGKNNCVINVFQNFNRVVIISVIDNLVKGAAGQAIQNMNILFGIKEHEGLQR